MNRKEIILLLLITGGLALTGVSLTNEECFDCTQSLFSNNSSCSIVGGTCVNVPRHGGLRALFNHLKGIQIREDEDTYTLSCFPDCSIKIDKEALRHSPDSVIHLSPGTHH